MIQRSDGSFTSKTFLGGGAITANSICKFGADDDTLVLAAAQTDVLVAVSRDAVASGARGDFQMEGVTEIKLGGTVARGESVTSDAAGLGVLLVVTTASIRSCIGQAMASGVVGDIIPVHMNKWLAAPLT